MQGRAVNEKDFQTLVHEHYDRIFRAARFMCGDQYAAEDLVHETFLAAAQSFGRFQGRSSVYTWLYGIMLNKFRRWIRKRRTGTVSLHGLGREQERSIEETRPILKEAFTIHFVGKDSIKMAEENGFIDKGKFAIVDGVPHAQCLFMGE